MTGRSRERSTTSVSKVSSVTSTAIRRDCSATLSSFRTTTSAPQPAIERTRARRPRSTPASVGCSEVDLDLRPGLEAERARADLAAEAEQLVRREDAATAASDAARCPRARGAPRAGRCGRSSRSRCTAGSSACGCARPGRNPSPRSASVVGHAQIAAPADASEVELGAVRVRRVHDRSCALRGSPCAREARSGGSRALRGTPRSPSVARRHGRGAEALVLRGIRGRSPRASRPGTRGRSGGRGRPGARAPAESRPARGSPPTDSWRKRASPPRA